MTKLFQCVLAPLLLFCVFLNASTIAFAQGGEAQTEDRSVILREMLESLDKALKLEIEGQVDAALPLAERALSLGEQKLGADDFFLAMPLMSVGRLREKRGEHERALQLYQRALVLTEKAKGAEDVNLATLLDSIASLYLQKEDFAQAETNFKRSLAIREKALGAEHTDVAMSLENLGRVYADQGKFEEAETLLKRSLSIREKLAPAEPREVASSLNRLALLSASKGDYAEAEKLHLRALAIREREFGIEHPAVLASVNNLAELYREMGDLARAEPLYRRALAIAEKAYGAERAETGLLLNNLAGLFFRKGDYAQSETLYRRALAIREKALGGEHPFTAQTLTNLAVLYTETGDYAQAESLSRRALAIAEKVYPPEHQKLSSFLNNLAMVLEIKGDYPRAEELFGRALAIDEKFFGAEHPEVASDLNNLAGLQWRKQEPERAVPLHLRALAIREKALGAEHPDTLQSRNNLAVIYSDRGEYERAEQMLQSVLVAREKALGAEHPNVGATLNNLGALYHQKGDYARAEAAYLRALAIFEKAFGDAHPDVALCLHNLAILSSDTGRTTQALEYLTRGAEIRERNLSLMLGTGSEQQKLRYMATLNGETNAIVSLHARTAPKDAAMARLALETVLRRKGRALDVMSAHLASLRGRLNEQDRALLEQLSTARTRLAALTLKGAEKTEPEKRRAEAAQLEAEIERLEEAVSARSAQFRVESAPVTLERVQQAIPKNAALVEFVLYRPFNSKGKTVQEMWGAPRYVAYVLRQEGAPVWVELGEAAPIDEQAKALRLALKDAVRTDTKQLARALDEKLMRPVRALLGVQSFVLLSPDGALNLLPFAALVDEQNRFLVERYTFNYLTSGRDLLRLQASGESKQAPVIFANPLFGSAVEANNNQTAAKGATQKLSENLFDLLSQVKFKQLPGTAAEAKAIQILLPRASVWTGAQATESTIKRVSAPSILHVATHGFFLADQESGNGRSLGLALPDNTAANTENPLLRSGLVFAGANDKLFKQEGEDGILTALEAAGLDLWGTRLVVLSACETGVGDVKNGDGVYGLRRALVLAGAESQVMSLWQVSDLATRVLMSKYYVRLRSGTSRSEALRQVQIALLQSEKFSHPYYWAAFIPAGAWTALDSKTFPAR